MKSRPPIKTPLPQLTCLAFLLGLALLASPGLGAQGQAKVQPQIQPAEATATPAPASPTTGPTALTPEPVAPGPTAATTLPDDTAPGLRAVRLLILPYFSLDPGKSDSLAYALYAVPDLLREQLQTRQDLIILGREVLDQAGLAGTGGAFREAGDRLAAARACKADFVVWGYVIDAGEGLKVFHQLVDARSGTTVTVASALLPAGPALLEAMETSVFGFSTASLKALPASLEVETRVVEKLVEKVVEKVRTVQGKTGIALSLDAGVAVFPWTFAGSLAPVPSGGLTVSWKPTGQEIFDLGLAARFSMLKNTEGASLVDVVVLPLSLHAGLQLPLADFLALRLDLSGGAGLVFGRVGTELLSNACPVLSAALGTEWWPKADIGLAAGLRIHYDFGVYNNQDMYWLEPELALRFRF